MEWVVNTAVFFSRASEKALLGFRRFWSASLAIGILCVVLPHALEQSLAANPPQESSAPASPPATPADAAKDLPSNPSSVGDPEQEASQRAPPPTEQPNLAAERTELNLLGQTDTASGESRRNENVKFNPIDNNALREVNVRIGATATLVEEFEPQRRYFSAEFGTRPEPPIHVRSSSSTAITARSTRSTTAASSASVRSSRSATSGRRARATTASRWAHRCGAEPVSRSTAASSASAGTSTATS